MTASTKAKLKKVPEFAVQARIRNRKVELVRVQLDGGNEKVLATLPGKVPPRKKGVNLNSANLGRDLEKAFKAAVKHATRHG